MATVSSDSARVSRVKPVRVGGVGSRDGLGLAGVEVWLANSKVPGLKPKAMINMRRKNRSRGAQQFSAAPASGVGVGASNNIMDQDIDEHYWAQAAADQDAGGADFGGDMYVQSIYEFMNQVLQKGANQCTV